MNNTKCYVVTGVSGRTGAAVANTLMNKHKRVRVVVRTAEQGVKWAKQGAEVVVADLNDSASLYDAFCDAEGAYILSPPQYSQKDLFSRATRMAQSIAEAAIKAKLPKLVALSSIGAEQRSGTGWIAMNHSLEERLSQTGIAVTFIRAAFFMENWYPLVKLAMTQDTLPSFLAPLDQKLSMVATQDIGRISAEVLCEEWQGTRIIELEGPTLYSPNEVAEQLSKSLATTIQATLIPAPNWLQSMSGQGFSEAAIAGFIEMTQGINSGHIRFDNTLKIEHRRGTIPLEKIINEITVA